MNVLLVFLLAYRVYQPLRHVKKIYHLYFKIFLYLQGFAGFFENIIAFVIYQ